MQQREKIKLLHVLEAMGGGTKKLLELVVRNTPCDQFDITLALPPPAPYDPLRPLADPSFPNHMQAEGYKVVAIPMAGGGPRVVPNLRATFLLYSVIRREKYDIVHCWSSIGGFVGRLAARWAGVPAIIYSPEGFAFNEFISPWRRWLYIAAERFLGYFTDALITCSETERQQALEARVVPSEKIALIQNPLDTNHYDIEKTDVAAKKAELGLPAGDPVVGMVARLTPQKGPQYFIEAAAQIHRKMPQAHFILVGDGELRAEVEALVAKLSFDGTMHLLGNRNDYLEIMASFDVFVLSSLWEGLPYAPLEAMLLRKPVVATAITGSRDIIQDDSIGVLVPPKDSQALAKAILELLLNPDRAVEIGQRGEASIRQRFSVQNTVAQLTNLYQDLLEIKTMKVGLHTDE